MDILVTPAPINGTLRAISSKSHAHRLLIAAALASAKTAIGINSRSLDIDATIACLRSLGAGISEGKDSVTIEQPLHLWNQETAETETGKNSEENGEELPILNCGESGSTARFLLPVASAVRADFLLTGSGRLPERPFSSLCREMAKNGCSFTSDRVPLRCTGRLRPGNYELEGNVSSQFISGLLFVLPLLGRDSSIRLTTALESASYVELTLETLSFFGVKVKKTDGGFFIPGNQRYEASDMIYAEGDWSNAAFFLVMGALSGGVELRGLNAQSVQGDRKVLRLLEEFGAKITAGASSVLVEKGTLHGIEINAADIPDLVPVLAAAASLAEGTTRIYNAGRLRHKESDRLATTRETLSALGADITISGDELLIQGKKTLTGGTVSGCNDHRIVMTAAVAACRCEKPVAITGAQAVNKSYPDFFTDLAQAGGQYHVVNSGK